jgi:ATP/maltotriose-dependent transcriptional regulator MalT/DNA-binding SARP family transcriptional activator
MKGMPRPEPFALIDTLRDGSVSSDPPDRSNLEAPGPAQGGRSAADGDAGRRVRTPGLLGGGSRDGVSGYPIQVGKVQRPPLREETLARHRLLDWLDVKIHNRVVFVIAEAGYGKTTLLADFSRRTRLRTLWYRMDDEDRNWTTFVSYLVAAGREHDPDFAPRTHALLQDTGPGGASRDEVVAAFLRELPDIAPTPTVLILDDFHVAEGAGDISIVVRALINSAPERMTVVISSRRPPEVAVGRLRAQGELAELRTRDLQFSEREIAELFHSDHGQPLDLESIALLNRRSEGWAASLQLIRTAVRGRSSPEVRAFIRRLTGGQTELYDYLAEEVIGDLPPSHQAFLMRTALLQQVTAGAAAAVYHADPADVERLIALSERLGLLARESSASPAFRYHPLVREFLEARLLATIGRSGIQALHERAGTWAASVDWRTACHHFEAAGNIAAIHSVIDESINNIAGQGSYEVASDYLRRHAPAEPRASFEVIGSRIEFRRGNFEAAVSRANRAVLLQPNLDAAVSNAITMLGHVGDLEGCWERAKQHAETASSHLYRTMSRARCLMFEASLDGSLAESIQFLEDLAAQSESETLTHFAGVSHLNLAILEQTRGNVDIALRHADSAILELGQAFEDAELTAAYLARANALAHQGHLSDARESIAAARDTAPKISRGEWLIESADVEVAFGSAEVAESLLAEAKSARVTPSLRRQADTIEARLMLRLGDIDSALEVSARFDLLRASDQPGFRSRQMTIRAHAAVLSGSPEAASLVDQASRHAEEQEALLWARHNELLRSLQASRPGAAISALIRRTSENDLWFLDSFAEEVCLRLDQLDSVAREIIARRSSSRRDRWLPALRAVLAKPNSQARWDAAELLDHVGESEDIPILRRLARSAKGVSARATLGRALARRLAPRFTIQDLGRVEIQVGIGSVSSPSVRRKVLAMLCYLLTRPRFSATRDEVIDALWPDMSPDVAVNSLNQTVYFLRRVFEPAYVDDLSAGYVHHTSDVLWLDGQLISSQSSRCLEILDSIGSDLDPILVGKLSTAYRDRFALDFAYDEWAAPFRTSLHVGYLQAIEAAVTRDMAIGHHDRAIELARRALDLDPGVESLELALLRLYAATGAHAAAAEQYAHYASVLKDELGIDPPPLSSL